MPIIARTPFSVNDFLASPTWLRSGTNDDFSNFTYQQQQHQVRETDQAVELSLDVPGIKAQDLNVEVTEGGTVLRVSGERKTAGRESKFDRSFRLDNSAMDPSAGVKANLDAGVLTLTVAKRAKAAPKKIAITEEPAREEDDEDEEEKMAVDSTSTTAGVDNTKLTETEK